MNGQSRMVRDGGKLYKKGQIDIYRDMLCLKSFIFMYNVIKKMLQNNLPKDGCNNNFSVLDGVKRGRCMNLVSFIQTVEV